MQLCVAIRYATVVLPSNDFKNASIIILSTGFCMRPRRHAQNSAVLLASVSAASAWSQSNASGGGEIFTAFVAVDDVDYSYSNTGASSGIHTGYAVSTAGDINNDSYDDLMIW